MLNARQRTRPARLARVAGLLACALCHALPANADPTPTAGSTVTVWSAVSGTSDRAQLDQAIAQADYLILGEIHDNPWHHRLQAELLTRFAAHHGEGVSVGFEQLTVEQQPQIDTFLDRETIDAAAFGEAVAWAESGWPDYAIYRPLFEAALASRLRIVPLMFAGARAREVMHGDFDAVLPAQTLARLQPETLLGASEQEDVEKEMQDAHCGKLPANLLPGMVNVQIARDAFMASRMVGAGAPAVIITGNGHARRDRGIPRFLQRLQPDARIVVVMLLETSGDASPNAPAEPELTDHAVFTPAPARDDPCLAFQ